MGLLYMASLVLSLWLEKKVSNWQRIHGKAPFYYLSLRSVENSVLIISAFSELFDFFDFAQRFPEK